MKNETGIEWREDCDEFILSGRFDQVENAHKRLQEYFVQRPYLHLKQKHTETYSKNTAKSHQAEITDSCTFEVQPEFMKLLKRVYSKTLQGIEEEFCLEIVWGENASQVEIQPRQRAQERTLYKRGCDDFISLYQNVCLYIRREVVEIENVNDEEDIQNAIQLVEAKNHVIIEKSEKQLFVFAEENCIKHSVQSLRQHLGLLPINNQTSSK